MLKNRFAARFIELEKEFHAIPYEGRGASRFALDKNWAKWSTSAESLLLAACGARSPYYTNFIKLRGNNSRHFPDVQSLGGIFFSAKEAFEKGYLFDVERDVSAEIFGDFVVLAKRVLTEKNKDVAAVLASAALEDTLKQHAKLNGLDVDEKPMSEVINALKSKGLISGAQKSVLPAMQKVRNLAMHAEWKKLTEPEVSGIVAFVEQYLLTTFNNPAD